MGPVYTPIRLENALRQQSRVLEVRARVDLACSHLCLPETIVHALELPRCDVRWLRDGDGEWQEYSYVGPIKLQFGTRSGFFGALELGDEVVLGSIPMSDLDLVVDITANTLVPRDPSQEQPTVRIPSFRAC